MWFLGYCLLALVVIISITFRSPAPLISKIGLTMIAESVAMILGAGGYWGVTTLRNIYREVMNTLDANCLVWRHPENTKEGTAVLELVRLDDKDTCEEKSRRLQKRLQSGFWGAIGGNEIKKNILAIDAQLKYLKEQGKTSLLMGGDWFYKYFSFMPEKTVKWLFEEKTKDGRFILKAYNPDDEVSRHWTDDKGNAKLYPTTGELAEATRWDAALRRLKRAKSLVDQLALGSIIAIPALGLLAIMFLLDMLKQNAGG